MRRIILLLSFLMLQLSMAQQQASPNGDVQLSFSLSANGTPTYKVSYKGKEVVKESTLGFLLKETDPLTHDFKVVNTKKTTFKETRMGRRKRNSKPLQRTFGRATPRENKSLDEYTLPRV